MDDYAICPICRQVIVRDYKGNPDIIYMDGWHHKKCLDLYFSGQIELPTPKDE